MATMTTISTNAPPAAAPIITTELLELSDGCADAVSASLLPPVLLQPALLSLPPVLPLLAVLLLLSPLLLAAAVLLSLDDAAPVDDEDDEDAKGKKFQSAPTAHQVGEKEVAYMKQRCR